MNKKRCISVLCSTAAAVLIASAVSVGNVKAAVKSYIINNDGKFISFNADALLADYTNKLTDGASPMFDEYMKDAGNLYAFEDDKKGLVSASSVEEAYSNALVGNKTHFNVDNFTENVSDTDILKDVTVGYEWKNNGIVSVSDNNTTSISLNKTSDTLKVGDTDTLTAAVTSNNTTSNNVTWTSSDESIAAVDQTGKVTAVKEGTAAITATAADGNTKASCTVTVTAKDTDNTVVTFKDANLEQAVRDAINRPTGDIYKSDVEKITELKAEGKNIQDISGIENLTNLQSLYLGYTYTEEKLSDDGIIRHTLVTNQIRDISPLKSLSNLKILDLENNQIKDISALENLTNLKQLNLSQNSISDINALRGLVNLKDLTLQITKISDISALEGLTNLQDLDLGGNDQISDISVLKNLTNLKTLGLGAIKISDISVLKNLNNLQNLILSQDSISDISVLKGLTNLRNLSLENNQISDISALEGLTNLQELNLNGNQISDADKQSLKTALPNCEIDF